MAPALVTVEALAAGICNSPYLDLKERPWGKSSRIQVDDVTREHKGA
jgi:hypothetical protein